MLNISDHLKLTIESKIAKKGSEEVHDEHSHDGDIGNILHPFSRSAEKNTAMDS